MIDWFKANINNKSFYLFPLFLDKFDENFLESEVDSWSFLHHRHHKFNYFVVFELKDEVYDLVQPLASQPAV